MILRSLIFVVLLVFFVFHFGFHTSGLNSGVFSGRAISYILLLIYILYTRDFIHYLSLTKDNP